MTDGANAFDKDDSDKPEESTSNMSDALQAAEKAVADLVKRADSVLEPEEEELTFPARASRDQVKITRKRTFPAWVGRPERLVRIAGFIEDALRKAFDADKAKIEEEHSSPYIRKSRAERYVPETRVSGGAGRLERTGDIDLILSDMDTSEVEWVSMANSPFSYVDGSTPKISVEFGQKRKSHLADGGVEIEVTGSDKQWVAGVYDTLVNEVAKDVPWWSRLLSGKAQLGFVLILALAVPLVLSEWAPEVLAGGGALVVGLATATVGMGIYMAVRRWVLVPFELLGPGERSTARRVGSSLLILLTVVSGLVTIWAVVLRE